MNNEFRKNPLGLRFSPVSEINKSRKNRIIYFISFIVITTVGPLFFRIVLNSLISLIIFLTVQWILHCKSNYLERVETDSNILLPHRKFTFENIPEINDYGILVVILEKKVDYIKVIREESLNLESYILKIDKIKKMQKNTHKVEFYYFYSCFNVIRLYQLWITLIIRHRITNYTYINFSEEIKANLKVDLEFFLNEANTSPDLNFFIENIQTEWNKFVFTKVGKILTMLENVLCDLKYCKEEQQEDIQKIANQLYKEVVKKEKKIDKLKLRFYFDSVKNKLTENNII